MMVYVWTLSDPETRVKIQGDSRTHLSSPRSSSETGPKHPVFVLCFWGGRHILVHPTLGSAGHRA